MKKVLIIGDSFVEGVGASSERAGWAWRYADSSKGEVTVSGEGGNNTVDLLRRLADHKGSRYDLVVIQIGLNDSRLRPSRQGQEVPIDEFQANVDAIVALLEETGARVALMGLTRVDESRTSPYKKDKHYRNDLIEQYDQILRQVAQERGAEYVPVPALSDEPGNLFDGLHPSQAGHDKLLASFLASASS